ncbi:hypothetical protein FRC18_011191 [Serendipita sp. 400]|nr:hypothetical protein FRC18_011191 [Serendipita sp. 400]
MDKFCSELTLRIRELEKGLQDERAGHSSEPHPLLDDSLLSIVAPPTKQDYEVEDGPINFGTLMIADDGSRMKWLGSTAVSAWFLDVSSEDVPIVDRALIVVSFRTKLSGTPQRHTNTMTM